MIFEHLKYPVLTLVKQIMGFPPESFKKAFQEIIVENTFNFKFCVLGPIMRRFVCLFVFKAFFVDQVNDLFNIGDFFVKEL